jgi:DNA repair protein RadC
MNVRTETAPVYFCQTNNEETDNMIIINALAILKHRLRVVGPTMTAPKTVKNYLTLKLAELEHEVFGCLFLDNQNQLIEDEVLFRGTIDETSVYPREVLKETLKHNANALILYHNHPSFLCEPSSADKDITNELKEALKLIDVRILDHFIVAGRVTYSFAENGLI